MVAKRFRIASIGSEARCSATCAVDLEGDDRLLSMPRLPHGRLLPPVSDGGLSGPSGRCPSQGSWTMSVTPPLSASASRLVRCAPETRAATGAPSEQAGGLDTGEMGSSACTETVIMIISYAEWPRESTDGRRFSGCCPRAGPVALPRGCSAARTGRSGSGGTGRRSTRGLAEAVGPGSPRGSSRRRRQNWPRRASRSRRRAWRRRAARAWRRCIGRRSGLD